ncbi:MAG: hypothetical protein EON58_09765 [Alphaproteobacteria bacterium]|nr:MAG: hypothetical protein EON58_09765 [Alphaproteobacteria bacterium]
MKWRAFRYQETDYDLGHLDPFEYDLVVPAKDGKPERSYRLNVSNSMHCFTRGARKGESMPAELSYRDSRETRIFEFDRYAQSKLLPEIVRSLAERKCHHDAHGNFYVFEIIDSAGTKQYYSVFFTLSKAGKKAGLNLFITTAHTRPEQPYAKNEKPVRFNVIVHNIWTGKGVKPAP